jgi:uncharacterized membrane protein
LTSEVWKRSVGVIGLYVLIGIVFCPEAPGLNNSSAALPVSPKFN